MTHAHGTGPSAGALPGFVVSHLGSRDVARTIYGAIVGLAVVVAVQDHPPPDGVIAVLLVATAISIGLAELYSEAISLEARSRAPLGRRQLGVMGVEAVWVVAGAAFPAIFFGLAALHAFGTDLAFTLAKWSGLALISGYGFLAARLAGATVVRCLAHATALGLLAGALIALKAILH